MVNLKEELVDILIKVAKVNGVSYNEVKNVYIALFDFLIKEFSQIKDTDYESWNKNVIVKNFGKFVVNKNKLKRYESKRKINEQSNELTE